MATSRDRAVRYRGRLRSGIVVSLLWLTLLCGVFWAVIAPRMMLSVVGESAITLLLLLFAEVTIITVPVLAVVAISALVGTVKAWAKLDATTDQRYWRWSDHDR
jgi:hypothetical protein